VAVGYVYENCASRPYWEVQSAKIAGSDMMSSEIGGWNVDVHHVYSIQEGIIFMHAFHDHFLFFSTSSYFFVFIFCSLYFMPPHAAAEA